MRWVGLVAIVLAGCGRIGFDVGVDDGGADADDAPTGPGEFIISATQLAPAATGFSWVTIDVDWARSLAYVGTRENGKCVGVVDFADELAPRIAGWIDGGPQRCLEVELLDPQRLVVISQQDSLLMLWSLGADPRAGLYTQLDSIPISSPRHFSIDRAGVAPRILVAADPSPSFVEVAVVGSTFSSIGTWPGTCSMPYQVALATSTGLAVGCQADNSPIELLARSTYASRGTIPNLAVGTSGVWTGTTLADGRVVMLGWANVVVDDTTLEATWKTPADGYRDVIETEPGVIWAANGDGTLEKLSLAQPGVVRELGKGSLTGGKEAYGVRIDPTGRRGVAVTNRGLFAVFDPARIPPTGVIR